MTPAPPGPPPVRVPQHCWFAPQPTVDVHARVTCCAVHAVVPHAYVTPPPPPPKPKQHVSPVAHELSPQRIPVPTQLGPTHEAQRWVVVLHDRPDWQSPSATH